MDLDPGLELQGEIGHVEIVVGSHLSGEFEAAAPPDRDTRLQRPDDLAPHRRPLDRHFDVGQRPQASPFSLRKRMESETFSWTPTLRGLRPSAMPSSCVK